MMQSLHILLADDDRDDRTFFKDALDELPLSTLLTTVNNGEELMHYLGNHSSPLPDILFLDLNMPRKNGSECLTAIKSHPLLKAIRVVILSTSYDEVRAKQLYACGASYYLCKPSDFNELKKVIHSTLLFVQQNDPKEELFNL